MDRAIANGDISPQKISECLTFGAATKIATQWRDYRTTPQQAYSTIRGYAGNRLPDASLKKIVNIVYFAPSFANASPNEMEAVSTNWCLDPDHTFAPHYQAVE